MDLPLDTVARISQLSQYPEDWQLTPAEVTQMLADCEAALATTNGDAGEVTLTARQVLLLLNGNFNKPCTS